MGDINLDKIPLERIGPFAKFGIGLLKKMFASAWKRYGKRKIEYIDGATRPTAYRIVDGFCRPGDTLRRLALKCAR